MDEHILASNRDFNEVTPTDSGLGIKRLVAHAKARSSTRTAASLVFTAADRFRCRMAKRGSSLPAPVPRPPLTLTAGPVTGRVRQLHAVVGQLSHLSTPVCRKRYA